MSAPVRIVLVFVSCEEHGYNCPDLPECQMSPSNYGEGFQAQVPKRLGRLPDHES